MMAGRGKRDRGAAKPLGSAFLLDTWRSWLHAWKPFLSILIISMLGVAVLTGIYAGCRDALIAANRFYGQQGLHDVQIVSTMGLTDEDVDALRRVDGVDSAVGVRMERVTFDGDAGRRLNATLREPSDGGSTVDAPYVREGRLPKAADEVAVTAQFTHDTHRKLGDVIDVTAADDGDGTGGDDGDDDAVHKLKIVGVVTDPSDLSNPDGYSGSAFRTAVANDYTVYVAPGALEKTFGADDDVYGAVVLRLTDAENKDAFADDYDALVSSTMSEIERTVQPEREESRRKALQQSAQDELDKAKEQAYAQINEAQAQLDAQRTQLDGQLKLLDAQAAQVPVGMPMPTRLAEAQRQWAQADAQLKEAQQRIDTQRNGAGDRFAAEQQQVDDIAPRWYVQSRSALSGFSSLKSDISSIRSLGNAFPIVFLVVAVMMSLTTMSRLVEEDRGLIGAYLGLGYGRAAITARYALFALLAGLLGGGLGLLIGFLGIPAFLLVVIHGLYAIPDLRIEYDWLYGSMGVLLFVVGVLGAALFASIRDMRQMPAALMRPKAPKAGSRILLERIRPLWRRMSFLNKVTARNIFRFKSRLIMTVGGVAGCAALILCALAINDTVAALGPNQYRGVDQYDMFAMANDGEEQSLRDRLVQDGETTAIMQTRVENGEITNGGGSSTSVQLTIVPQGQLGELNTMFRLEPARGESILGWLHGRGNDQPVTLGDDGVIVAQSAAQSLGVKAGDEIMLRADGRQPHRVKVSAVTRSLIGAEVFIAEGLYHRMFPSSTAGDGVDAQPAITWNAVYAKLKGDDDAQVKYVQRLEDDAIVLSASSTAYQAEHFKFDLMGAVVALIVALAGSLALVVLFTLAHTNVSERMREMATLKVLGFYDKEVHRYVNREMMVLTLIGLVIGLPLGRWVAGLLTGVLNMPGLYFEVHIFWWSYVVTVVATLAFTLLVQLFVDPVLDRIDPVSSLKSVE